MLIKRISRYAFAGLLHFWFWGTQPLQAQEMPMADMAWSALTEKWEELTVSGKIAEALPYARAALEKARADSTEESLEYGNSLDYLGYSLHHLGQYTEAERSFLGAVHHARIHLGENHEDYITRLSNLAMLHMDMEKLAQSVSELEEACRLAEKNLPDDNPYVGILINNLGLNYERIGNYGQALKCYLRALELTERTVGKESYRYAIRLSNIAAIYRRTGENEKSLEYALRALPIIEKSVGKKHPVYTLGLNGLLNAYIELNKFEAALPLSDTLLTLLNSGNTPKTHESYNVIQSIANLYYKAGQYERCVNISEAALSEYGAIFPRLYASHAFLAHLLMSTFEKTGNLADAQKYALLLNQCWLGELREKMVNLSESEQIRLHNGNREREASVLLFAYHHPDLAQMADMAFDCQLSSKGYALANQSALLHSLRNSPDTLLAAQFEDWQKLQAEISRQYALTPTHRLGNLDSLLSCANALERNLALGSESFRLANQHTRWQEVQAALSPGEAALEFGQITLPHSDSLLYTAYLVRYGDTCPIQRFLFEEKELGNLAATRRLYALEHASEGKNLNEALWKPLEPLLKNVTTLYFAPAGILHQINFGAVPITPAEIIADRFQLHRLVSTRLIPAVKRKQEAIPPKSALVFGGIRYEADSLALGLTNASLENDPIPMPQTLKRTNPLGTNWGFLSESLKEAHDAQSVLMNAGAEVKFAEGFKASEGYLKKTILNARAPEVLHLATHGFFLIAPDTHAKTGFAAAEDPMVRAGLVLSGANRVWSGQEPLAGQEDGILTAREISRLDLNGTRLAVLSACGTGQGEIAAGEGVFGLQRAFKMAGTQYVIMTLWPVQDNDAQQFMGFFYHQWLERKVSIPLAFREAQRMMRSAHAKPFQPMAWAGFVLLE